MKPKTAITGVLLLFVAASIIHLVVKETGGNGKTPPPETAAASGGRSTLEPGSPIGPTDGKPAKRKVVAYYFHGNMRCITCRTIEAYAQEAVETGFGKALQEGRLDWRVVNVEEPGNEHFIQDFQLTTRSVVIQEFLDGKSTRWNNLGRVWALVRKKDSFLKYVQDETRAYLEAKD